MSAPRLALLLVALASAVLPAVARADVTADRATLARLEQRSKAFYELLVRGEREKAGGEWRALEADLDGFVDRVQGELDRMRDEMVERDGDLDELYRSPRWRDPEVMVLVATYHLAWVRYQAAQLVGDAAKKRSLLQEAVAAFSRFLLVNEVPEIYAESLYGRGLAFLDLGDTGKAIEDLRAASEQPGVGPKAHAALEEAQRRAGGKAAPAANDPETLLVRLGEVLPRAAGGDAGAEKEATTLARGLAVRGGPWPARVESVVVDRLGGGTKEGVHGSYGLFLLAELAVDRGRCADVPPLAEAGAKTHDAGRGRWVPELLFLDAGCRLNAGGAREAAEEFARLTAEFPDAPRAREAAYYRFRALDVARGTDPALTQAYEEALTAYLARYAPAEGAAEARFLLGELHRAGGDCGRAAADYAAVGPGPFAARARLGALECWAGELVGAKATPEARRDVLAALRAYAHETTDKSLAARATLLAALVAAGGESPDHAAVLELLDGFETRYPDAKDLHAAALDQRLVARVASGQLDGAARDLDAFLAADRPADEQRRILGRLSRDLAARAEHGNDAAALALARRVQAALVKQTDDPRDRIVLADLALRAGDAAEGRREYEAVLTRDPASAEALRGAARAAAAAGETDAALGYWRRVVDASSPGGTAWYEARIAQVTLLAKDGKRGDACALLRASGGRSTSVGGDQLAARLRSLEPDVCR